MEPIHSIAKMFALSNGAARRTEKNNPVSLRPIEDVESQVMRAGQPAAPSHGLPR